MLFFPAEIHLKIIYIHLFSDDYDKLDDIRYFQKERSIAVIITEYRYGFEALLHAPVIAMNEIARRRGVTTMMSGKEALLLCEAKKA